MTNIVQLLVMKQRICWLSLHWHSRESLHLPGPDYVDRVVAMKDRKVGVLRSLQTLYGHAAWPTAAIFRCCGGSGRGTFRRRVVRAKPDVFRSENIVKLAIEGGCNGVASTLGVLGSVAASLRAQDPFIVKINHNEMLTYPIFMTRQYLPAVDQLSTWARWRGATIFYGCWNIRAADTGSVGAFEHAHSLGMRPSCGLPAQPAFKTADRTTTYPRPHRKDRPTTSPSHQRRHRQTENGREQRRLQRDQVRQNQPKVYSELDHRSPDRSGALSGGELLQDARALINSGGNRGKDDLHQAVRTAVINSARRHGLDLRRKHSRYPMQAACVLNAIQDVYAAAEVTVA